MQTEDSLPWIILKVTDDQEGVRILHRCLREVPEHSNPADFLTSYDHVIPSSPASGLSDGLRSLDIDGSPRYPSPVSIDSSLPSLSSSHNPGLEVAQASDTGTGTDSYRRQPPPVNTRMLGSSVSSLPYSPHSPVSSSSSGFYSSPTSPFSDFNPVSSFENLSLSIPLGSPFYGSQPGSSAASESSASSLPWASPSSLMPGLTYSDTDQQLGLDCQEIGGLTVSTFPVSPASATSSPDYFASTSPSPSSSLLFSDANVSNSGPSFHAPTSPIARGDRYGYPQSLESSPRWSLQLFGSSDNRDFLNVSAARGSYSDSGSPIMVQSSPRPTFTSSDQNAYASDSGVLASSSSSDVGSSPNWRDEVATGAVAEAAIKRRRLDKPNRKLFNCPHCERNLTSSQNLRYHIFSHEGTKNFYCVDCGHAFTTPQVLKRHRRRGCPRRRRSRSL